MGKLSLRATELLHAHAQGERNVDAYARWLGVQGTLKSKKRAIERTIKELRGAGFVVERDNRCHERELGGAAGALLRLPCEFRIRRLYHPAHPDMTAVAVAAWMCAAEPEPEAPTTDDAKDTHAESQYRKVV